MTSPLQTDANATLAAESVRAGQGHALAVYACLRSTARVSDALVGLGLPLIDYVMRTVDDAPATVTAVRDGYMGSSSTLGLATEVERWAVLIRCASGMVITVDLASGPWTTAASSVELRVEWMGSESVTTLHPRGVMSVSQRGSAGMGLTGLDEELVEYATALCDMAVEGDLPAELSGALAIVEAARQSAAEGRPVPVA